MTVGSSPRKSKFCDGRVESSKLDGLSTDLLDLLLEEEEDDDIIRRRFLPGPLSLGLEHLREVPASALSGDEDEGTNSSSPV
jgi:hypothetical protein